MSVGDCINKMTIKKEEQMMTKLGLILILLGGFALVDYRCQGDIKLWEIIISMVIMLIGIGLYLK